MKIANNYRLLLISQFITAFGDNALIAIILGPLTFGYNVGKVSEQNVNEVNAILSIVFFLPYIVIAPAAGFFNDRFPKTRVLFAGNIIKLIGVGFCLFGLLKNLDLHFAGYYIVGIGACIYSPAKYGILPEIVSKDKLVKANGYVEMLTLAAILGGLWAGGKIIDSISQDRAYLFVILLYMFSGFLTVLMEKTSSNPEIRFFESVRDFNKNLKAIFRSPRLIRILLGTGIFWFAGAGLRSTLQSWGLNVLNSADSAMVSNEQLALLKIWLALGIIMGSGLAGFIHRTGDLRAVRIYGWLVAGFMFVLSYVMGRGFSHVTLIILLVTEGISAGLYLIPLNAALQSEIDRSNLGKAIATQNFIDNVAMVLSSGIVLILSGLAFSTHSVLAILASIIALIVVFLKVPPKSNNAQ
jgi:LPLT family lysophospholipid transporter-like MFS transporter